MFWTAVKLIFAFSGLRHFTALHVMASISAYVSTAPAAWLRITGPDAAVFLQGQFTNDLRNMAVGQAVYGLWLNQKGKVIADSMVVRGAEVDEYWIWSAFCPAEVIRQRLEDYIIADDVVVEDRTAGWMGVTLFGTDVAKWTRAEGEGGVVFPGRRGAEPSVEWIFPRADEAVSRVMLERIPQLGADELARRRIEAAIPAVPADIGLADLPNEGGLDRDAISFTKGCYLGQEVMARLKSMGQVRRRVLRVRGEGAVPALPAALWQGEKQVGQLRSAVAVDDGYIGLAMISLINVQAGQPLALSAGGAASVTLMDVPVP